jgi:S-adenosylmethionine decarboxylase
LKTLGRHLIAELFDCPQHLLQDVDVVQEILVSAAKVSGATIVQLVFHEFSPFGVSGVVVIAESHITVHTWPEHRFAAVDVFTCGGAMEPDIALQYIADGFCCPHPTVVELRRGAIPAARSQIKSSHRIDSMTT